MQPLKKLDNIDRAKLLFQLFPEEMPGLIQFSKQQCESIIENEFEARRQWEPNAIFSFDFYLSYVKDLLLRIKEYEKKLSRHCRSFTDQLFDGFTSIAMCQCVMGHGNERQAENPNYTLAVTLFFAHKY